MNSNLNIVHDQFIMKKKLSQGSFGVVYLGQDIQTKQYVAIKVEKNQEQSSVDREALFLKHLHNIPNIPKLYYSGHENNQNVMVIQFLGKDLTNHLRKFKKFSVKCAINIMDQMLSILENVHQKSILHRDIKPENILLGKDNDQILYLVDFGISKFYRDNKGNHVPFSDKKQFLGTTRYASLAAHKGYEQSRKDDLESLGYMIIYMLKGSLPWQQLKYTDETKVQSVGDMKQTMPIQELCRDLPLEFLRYLDYTRKLEFKATPDYNYLRKMFQKLYIAHNFMDSPSVFDWDINPARTSDYSIQKRVGRTPEQEKRSSNISSFMEVASGNSYLKMPQPHHKYSSLSPGSVERDNNRKKSNGSCNESSYNNSGLLSVRGQPSRQTNMSQLSFHYPINDGFQETFSKVTRQQLNDEHDDDSPSPLVRKYNKLQMSSLHAHFKRFY